MLNKKCARDEARIKLNYGVDNAGDCPPVNLWVGEVPTDHTSDNDKAHVVHEKRGVLNKLSVVVCNPHVVSDFSRFC